MDDSPLKKVPAEIRNRIAELALFQEIEVKQQKDSTRFIRVGNSAQKHPFALAQACRQLHTETYKMFYSVADFIIHADVPTLSYVVEDFLASLKPEVAGEIKHVTVRCDQGDITSSGYVDRLARRRGARTALENSVGHALRQLQRPGMVRMYLKLWYSKKKDIGWLQERVEETVIELDSRYLQRSWDEAKAKDEELQNIPSDLGMDLESCHNLMDKMSLG